MKLISCTLCHGKIEKAEKAYQRYLVDGKAKFDARASLSNLPFAVQIDSIHICKSCLNKLKKLDNLKRQERELLATLKEFATWPQQVPKTYERSLLSSPPGSPERDNVAKKRCIESKFTPFVTPISPVMMRISYLTECAYITYRLRTILWCRKRKVTVIKP